MDKFARQEDTIRRGQPGRRTCETPAQIHSGIAGRSRIFQPLARLARRPLQRGPEFNRLCVVREIHVMKAEKLQQLMKAGHRVLSPGNPSMFFGNVKRTSQGFRSLILSETTFRVPWSGSRHFKDQCRKGLAQVATYWRRKRILVAVKVQFICCRALTLLSFFDPTTKWGYRERTEFL